MSIIECKKITKVYTSGGVETIALRNVSFSIQEGDFTAIMGPSGSGKSTLMHILGCLDSPTSGSYFLDNKDVSQLSDGELAAVRKQRIGFVFQAYNLLPRITALRNVMLPLIYSGGVPAKEREERAKKALMSAALTKDWDHLSNQLSGGQMQRVAIARALINNPAIILADEPTGNLDSKSGEVVLQTFKRLNKEEKRTIIFITHERYVAEHANRILHIRDGEIIKDEREHTPRSVAAN